MCNTLVTYREQGESQRNTNKVNVDVCLFVCSFFNWQSGGRPVGWSVGQLLMKLFSQLVISKPQCLAIMYFKS